MAAPLNAVLYSWLKRKFGEVRFSSEGCPAHFDRLVDPLNSRRSILRAASWGEYYCVCCPFCHDNRYRLYINHRYASEVIDGERQFTHLAICYNEHCLEKPGKREQLEMMIFGHGAHLKPRPCPVRPVTTKFEPAVVEPPGTIALLSDLPPDHAARAYVQSRGFDPDALSANFGIGFCVDVADNRYAKMRNRLYIPATYKDELIGWQCRAITPDDQPKYLNAPNMRKSAMLYNYDQAAKQPFVVVVEGVTSVWRLGPAAVCLFGKSMSFLQQNLIAKTWGQKPVFLMLDSDARVEMDAAKAALMHQSVKVITIELPDARDPADYSIGDITAMLCDRASEAGVLQNLA